MSIDLKWFEEQVDTYQSRFGDYKEFATTLESVLKKASSALGVPAIIQARPKAVASFAEKILRKRHKYRDPVNQLTDLCGGRVIADTKADVDRFCRFIRSSFEIDDANSEDTALRLETEAFGYRSVHYIVQFPPDLFPNDAVPITIPKNVLELENPKAEIQVRTVAQHAWADIGHDRIYKSEFKVPASLKRESARVAAVLENVDDTFQRLVDSIEEFRQHYDAYMAPEQMEEELEIVRSVIQFDEKNSDLAKKVSRLQMLLGRWNAAAEFLDGFDGKFTPGLQRIHGEALCRAHENDPRSADYQRGIAILSTAADADPPNVEALSDLARRTSATDERRAMQLFERAFEAAPSDPLALGGYLESRIRRLHNHSMIPPLRPSLETAVERCYSQAAVGVNLPEALYRAGQFLLLLGRPHESLHSYCQAVAATTTVDRINDAIDSTNHISDTDPPFVNGELVRRLLILFRTVRFSADSADNQMLLKATPGVAPIRGPVVIVAGGCDPSVQSRIESYRPLVLDAFDGFEGTIISGGSTSGVSGIVGEVAAKYSDALQSIGYLPKTLPSNARRDDRYHEIRKTDGQTFTELEPLQCWADIVASGIRPEDVTILGVNGGSIAEFEYQLALTLGARVGVIRDSGRAADLFVRQVTKHKLPRLASLPADLATVQTFIRLNTSQKLLDRETIEELAKTRHEQYREEQKQRHAHPDPAMRDWSELPDTLKNSNRQQIEHIGAKLAAVGMETVAVADVDSIELIEFTHEEIEKMAELEHARWNVERLLDSWTPGPRDPDAKTSPYLEAWNELDDNVRKWDRQTILAIPELLQRVGLEIRRVGQNTRD